MATTANSTTSQKTASDTKATVTDIQEAAQSRVQRIKEHPATKRAVRNTMRLGIVGLGYTICDEGLNRTSFNGGEGRVAVLWNTNS